MNEAFQREKKWWNYIVLFNVNNDENASFLRSTDWDVVSGANIITGDVETQRCLNAILGYVHYLMMKNTYFYK